MKKIQKTIIQFLIVCICSTIMGFPASANDISGTRYVEAVTVLTSMGIMNGYTDGTFMPENKISRGEFAVAVANILSRRSGLPAVSSKAVFEDVPANHWSAAGVYFLKERGIIADGEKFYPNAAITLIQAERMLLKAMGYGTWADTDIDCINHGRVLELTKNVLTAGNDGMSRGDAAILIYNAITAEKEVDFGENKGKRINLLSYMKMKKLEGQVVAANAFALNGYSKAPLNSITIYEKNERQLYDVFNDISIDEEVFAGSGKFFVEENDGEYRLVCYWSKKTQDLIYIDAQTLINVQDNQITYNDKNNRTKNLLLSENFILIYNGSQVTEDYYAHMQPKIGSIELRSSSGSNKYDIVIVKDYQPFIVEAVDYTNNKILFKRGIFTRQSVLLDDFDEVSIYRDSKPSQISAIKAWDVVHIMVDASNTKLTILAESKNYITGRVTGLAYPDDIYLDNSPMAIDYEVVNANLFTSLSIGQTIKMYYDDNGRGFAWTLEDSSEKFGYIYKLAYEPNQERMFARIYTLDDILLNVDCARKVTVNGRSQTYLQMLENNALFGTSGFIDQLTEFELNSEGELYKITTALNIEGSQYEERGYCEGVFSMVLKNKINTSDPSLSEYIKIDHFNNGKFNDQYTALSDAKVMMIPTDFDGEYFQISNVKNAFTNNGAYRDNKPLSVGEVYLYNSDRYFRVPLIVCKTDKSTTANSENIDTTTSALLVNKVYMSADDENEIVYRVNGYYEGKETDLVINRLIDVEALNIHSGTVMQYNLNDKGEISAIRVLFDCSTEQDGFVRGLDNKKGENETVGWNDNLLIFHGGICDKSDDGTQYVINTGLNWDKNRGFYSDKTYIYRYNREREMVDVISSGEIFCSYSEPAEVFFRAYRSCIKDMIIIE